MKIAKNLKEYIDLLEGKFEEEITDIQKERVRDIIGTSKYNIIKGIEVPEKNKEIPNGKWQLTEKEKSEAIAVFFNIDTARINVYINSLPEQFVEVVKLSSDNKIDLKELTLLDIVALFDNIFKTINVNETRSNEIIDRDEAGRPKRDEANRIIKRPKKEDEKFVFSNNKSNINTIIESYNSIVPENERVQNKFTENMFSKVVTIVKENPDIKDFNILSEKPMYLYITSKPSDILNMSVSSFYTSCQDLFRTSGSGSHSTQLPINVFDVNSKPAFLIFDTPLLGKDKSYKTGVNSSGGNKFDEEIVSPFVAFSRMIIRFVEARLVKDRGFFFHRAYPDRMRPFMVKIVEKYAGIKHTDKEQYTMRLPQELSSDLLAKPYMDSTPKSLRLRTIYRLVEPPKVSSTKKVDLKVDINTGTKLIINTNLSKNIEIDEDNVVETLIIASLALKRIPDDLLDGGNFSKLKTVRLEMCKASNIEGVAMLQPKELFMKWCKVDDFAFLNSMNSLELLDLYDIEVAEPNVEVDFTHMDSLSELRTQFGIIKISDSILKAPALKKVVMTGENYTLNRKVLENLKKKGVEVVILGPRL